MKKQRMYDGFVKLDEVDTPQGLRVVITATDSVAMFIYDATNRRVLLVKQPRAPMISEDNPTGEITEVAAGRFDKKIDLRDLVVDEVQAELGVTASPDEVKILNFETPMAYSPGVLTEKVYLTYIEVHPDKIDSEDRVYGDPKEGESITRRFVPVKELEAMKFDDLKTWALAQWFLRTVLKD